MSNVLRELCEKWIHFRICKTGCDYDGFLWKLELSGRDVSTALVKRILGPPEHVQGTLRNHCSGRFGGSGASRGFGRHNSRGFGRHFAVGVFFVVLVGVAVDVAVVTKRLIE